MPEVTESRRARVDQRLARIVERAPLALTNEEAMNALSNCEQALYRAQKRAEKPPGDMERVEIAQRHGPTLEFTGRCIAGTQFKARGGMVDLQVWETQGGALVAAEAAPGRGMEEDWRALVVPANDDEQAMRFAVMDFFGWGDRARKMAARAGWSLRMEVG